MARFLKEKMSTFMFTFLKMTMTAVWRVL